MLFQWKRAWRSVLIVSISGSYIELFTGLYCRKLFTATKLYMLKQSVS